MAKPSNQTHNFMKIFLRGSTFYLKFMFKRKQYWRALKTANRKEAEARAKVIHKQILDEHFKPDDSKLRNDFSTIGEVMDRYLERSVSNLRPSTARKNIGALSIIVREGLVSQADPRSQRLTVLTKELARKFQTKRQLAAGADFTAKERANGTINSMLRQAKSVFSKRSLEFYQGLKLPDLTGFMGITRLAEADHSYQPLNEFTVARMQAAAQKLKNENPPLYLVYLLFLRMGLRNSEIVSAKWTWVEENQNGASLAIVTRPDFKPKGKEGLVPIPKDVLAELQAQRKDEFLIPATTPTDRSNLVYREHSAWVKQFIPGRSKTSYELRKHAGSIVATRDGNLMNAQAFLRHQSPVTTAKHYASLLKPVQPIEANQVAG